MTTEKQAGSALSVKERVLYHQVHPAKLATDISTSIVSAVLFAEHMLLPALAVLLIPSMLVSAYMVATFDFTKVRDSRTGRYLRRHMKPGAQVVRLVGEALIVFGAWTHRWGFIPVGASIIVLAWAKGWLVERLRRTATYDET